MQLGSFINEAAIANPGPGTYTSQSTLSNIQYSLRPKTANGDYIQQSIRKNTPGPGTYASINTISQDGKQFISKYASSQVRVFGTEQRISMAKLNGVPGVGAYDVDKGKMDNDGQYFLSKYSNNEGRTFARDNRKPLNDAGILSPGPGAYQTEFTEFGNSPQKALSNYQSNQKSQSQTTLSVYESALSYRETFFGGSSTTTNLVLSQSVSSIQQTAQLDTQQSDYEKIQSFTPKPGLGRSSSSSNINLGKQISFNSGAGGSGATINRKIIMKNNFFSGGTQNFNNSEINSEAEQSQLYLGHPRKMVNIETQSTTNKILAESMDQEIGVGGLNQSQSERGVMIQKFKFTNVNQSQNQGNLISSTNQVNTSEIQNSNQKPERFLNSSTSHSVLIRQTRDDGIHVCEECLQNEQKKHEHENHHHNQTESERTAFESNHSVMIQHSHIQAENIQQIDNKSKIRKTEHVEEEIEQNQSIMQNKSIMIKKHQHEDSDLICQFCNAEMLKKQNSQKTKNIETETDSTVQTSKSILVRQYYQYEESSQHICAECEKDSLARQQLSETQSIINQNSNDSTLNYSVLVARNNISSDLNQAKRAQDGKNHDQLNETMPPTNAFQETISNYSVLIQKQAEIDECPLCREQRLSQTEREQGQSEHLHTNTGRVSNEQLKKEDESSDNSNTYSSKKKLVVSNVDKGNQKMLIEVTDQTQSGESQWFNPETQPKSIRPKRPNSARKIPSKIKEKSEPNQIEVVEETEILVQNKSKLQTTDIQENKERRSNIVFKEDEEILQVTQNKEIKPEESKSISKEAENKVNRVIEEKEQKSLKNSSLISNDGTKQLPKKTGQNSLTPLNHNPIETQKNNLIKTPIHKNKNESEIIENQEFSSNIKIIKENPSTEINNDNDQEQATQKIAQQEPDNQNIGELKVGTKKQENNQEISKNSEPIQNPLELKKQTSLVHNEQKAVIKDEQDLNISQSDIFIEKSVIRKEPYEENQQSKNVESEIVQTGNANPNSLTENNNKPLVEPETQHENFQTPIEEKSRNAQENSNQINQSTVNPIKINIPAEQEVQTEQDSYKTQKNEMQQQTIPLEEQIDGGIPKKGDQATYEESNKVGTKVENENEENFQLERKIPVNPLQDIDINQESNENQIDDQELDAFIKDQLSKIYDQQNNVIIDSQQANNQDSELSGIIEITDVYRIKKVESYIQEENANDQTQKQPSPNFIIPEEDEDQSLKSNDPLLSQRESIRELQASENINQALTKEQEIQEQDQTLESNVITDQKVKDDDQTINLPQIQETAQVDNKFFSNTQNNSNNRSQVEVGGQNTNKEVEIVVATQFKKQQKPSHVQIIKEKDIDQSKQINNNPDIGVYQTINNQPNKQSPEQEVSNTNNQSQPIVSSSIKESIQTQILEDPQQSQLSKNENFNDQNGQEQNLIIQQQQQQESENINQGIVERSVINLQPEDNQTILVVKQPTEINNEKNIEVAESNINSKIQITQNQNNKEDHKQQEFGNASNQENKTPNFSEIEVQGNKNVEEIQTNIIQVQKEKNNSNNEEGKMPISNIETEPNDQIVKTENQMSTTFGESNENLIQTQVEKNFTNVKEENNTTPMKEIQPQNIGNIEPQSTFANVEIISDNQNIVEEVKQTSFKEQQPNISGNVDNINQVQKEKNNSNNEEGKLPISNIETEPNDQIGKIDNQMSTKFGESNENLIQTQVETNFTNVKEENNTTSMKEIQPQNIGIIEPQSTFANVEIISDNQNIVEEVKQTSVKEQQPNISGNVETQGSVSNVEISNNLTSNEEENRVIPNKETSTNNFSEIVENQNNKVIGESNNNQNQMQAERNYHIYKEEDNRIISNTEDQPKNAAKVENQKVNDERDLYNPVNQAQVDTKNKGEENKIIASMEIQPKNAENIENQINKTIGESNNTVIQTQNQGERINLQEYNKFTPNKEFQDKINNSVNVENQSSKAFGEPNNTLNQNQGEIISSNVQEQTSVSQNKEQQTNINTGNVENQSSKTNQEIINVNNQTYEEIQNSNRAEEIKIPNQESQTNNSRNVEIQNNIELIETNIQRNLTQGEGIQNNLQEENSKESQSQTTGIVGNQNLGKEINIDSNPAYIEGKSSSKNEEANFIPNKESQSFGIGNIEYQSNGPTVEVNNNINQTQVEGNSATNKLENNFTPNSEILPNNPINSQNPGSLHIDGTENGINRSQVENFSTIQENINNNKTNKNEVGSSDSLLKKSMIEDSQIVFNSNLQDQKNQVKGENNDIRNQANVEGKLPPSGEQQQNIQKINKEQTSLSEVQKNLQQDPMNKSNIELTESYLNIGQRSQEVKESSNILTTQSNNINEVNNRIEGNNTFIQNKNISEFKQEESGKILNNETIEQIQENQVISEEQYKNKGEYSALNNNIENTNIKTNQLNNANLANLEGTNKTLNENVNVNSQYNPPQYIQETQKTEQNITATNLNYVETNINYSSISGVEAPINSVQNLNGTGGAAYTESNYNQGNLTSQNPNSENTEIFNPANFNKTENLAINEYNTNNYQNNGPIPISQPQRNFTYPEGQIIGISLVESENGTNQGNNNIGNIKITNNLNSEGSVINNNNSNNTNNPEIESTNNWMSGIQKSIIKINEDKKEQHSSYVQPENQFQPQNQPTSSFVQQNFVESNINNSNGVKPETNYSSAEGHLPVQSGSQYIEINSISYNTNQTQGVVKIENNYQNFSNAQGNLNLKDGITNIEHSQMIIGSSSLDSKFNENNNFYQSSSNVQISYTQQGVYKAQKFTEKEMSNTILNRQGSSANEGVNFGNSNKIEGSNLDMTEDTANHVQSGVFVSNNFATNNNVEANTHYLSQAQGEMNYTGPMFSSSGNSGMIETTNFQGPTSHVQMIPNANIAIIENNASGLMNFSNTEANLYRQTEGTTVAQTVYFSGSSESVATNVVGMNGNISNFNQNEVYKFPSQVSSNVTNFQQIKTPNFSYTDGIVVNSTQTRVGEPSYTTTTISGNLEDNIVYTSSTVNNGEFVTTINGSSNPTSNLR